MMGIEWIYRFCFQVVFVMKIDFDMFINIYYLIELFLKKNRIIRFFIGFLKMYDYSIRMKQSKWFVSKYEYSWDRYLFFCSGIVYVFFGDVVRQVYEVFEIVLFFKLEDVFVGFCFVKLKIKSEEFYFEQIFFLGGLSFFICRFRKIVVFYFVKFNDMLIYWYVLESFLGEECLVV